MTYTIIGGEVNIAARLETAGDAGKILMSNETYAHVQDMIDVKETFYKNERCIKRCKSF